jgi:hypothetical protein
MKHLRAFSLLIFLLFTLTQTAYGRNTTQNTALSTAFNTIQLEPLLKASATAIVQYEERRESPWLDAPQYSRGTLSVEGSVLIKTATSPRQEIWRLHAEFMEANQSLSHTEATPEQTRQIRYSQAPRMGVFANALRAVVMGNLSALPEKFMLEITGTELGWRLALTPKRSEDQRVLSRIEFTGAREGIEIIIVTEPQGEKTTTTLLRPHS